VFTKEGMIAWAVSKVIAKVITIGRYNQNHSRKKWIFSHCTLVKALGSSNKEDLSVAKKLTLSRAGTAPKKASGRKPGEKYHNAIWVSRDFSFVYAWMRTPGTGGNKHKSSTVHPFVPSGPGTQIRPDCLT